MGKFTKFNSKMHEHANSFCILFRCLLLLFKNYLFSTKKSGIQSCRVSNSLNPDLRTSICQARSESKLIEKVLSANNTDRKRINRNYCNSFIFLIVLSAYT